MKTLEESVNDIYSIMATKKSEGVPPYLIALALKARDNNDNKLMGDVLAELERIVGQKAGGFKIASLDSDQFGKKIGKAITGDKLNGKRKMGQYLGYYMRSLAQPAMEEAVKLATARGMVKEVVREATGDSTCHWCLDRCGIWTPYDANAYGVWAKHYPTCDCNIYIRWTEDTSYPRITSEPYEGDVE